MSEQNAAPRPVYRRLRGRAPNAADVVPTDVAMSDATDVGDVAPTGGAGPSLAAGGAGERGTKRRHGREIQSTGVEVGQMPPRQMAQILFDGRGYVKLLVQQHRLVTKENNSLIRSLLSDVGSTIDELKKTLEIKRHSFSASLESTYQECAQKLAEEKANADRLFEELVKCKASHDQAFNDAFSTLTKERERLVEQYDHSRKSDESLALSFAGKIDQLGQSLNMRDQDENASAKLVVDASELAPGLWAEPSTIP